MIRISRAQAALAVGVAVLTAAGLAIAIETVDTPATVGQSADRVVADPGDVAAIFDVQEVDQAVVDATFRIAARSGAAAATARTGSMGMVRIARNGATVHSAPDGYLIPMVFLALPAAGVAGVVGTDVSALMDADTVVMNEMTATQTGAQVGDIVELTAVDGSLQPFRIAGIRSYQQVGGSELIMRTDGANRLGAFEDTQTVVWSIDSRAAFDQAVAEEALESRRDTRVSRSWSPANPDDTLSTARTKQALGEPWYVPVSDTTIAMHPTWVANNLTAGRVLMSGAIPVRAQCHVRIVADLQAAFAEVAAAGLGGAIEVGNTNTYGGCYNPRYSRLSGFLSRHAYAQAIDMNTVSNCQGCVPRMDCRVVQIFRRHGFAWGGNFRRPDGMHFEWVGERRDLLSYPSNYCPNAATAGAQSADATAQEGRDVLVDSLDALVGDEHDH